MLIPAHRVAMKPPCCVCFAGNSTKHNREQVKNNNKLYLNTVATELMCFYKYSKNVFIHIYIYIYIYMI